MSWLGEWARRSAIDEAHYYADRAWHSMTDIERREMRDQALLAIPYFIVALLLIVVGREHARRSHGAARGRWVPGRWVS